MARQKENLGLELLEMSRGRGERRPEPQLPARGAVQGNYSEGGAYSKSAGSARVFRIVRPDGSIVYTDIPDGPGRVQQVAGYKEKPGSLRYTEIRPMPKPAAEQQVVQSSTVVEPEQPVRHSALERSQAPVEGRAVTPQEQQQEGHDDLISMAALYELLGHMGSSAAQQAGGGFAQMLGDAIAPDPSSPINQYQDEQGFWGQMRNHRQIIGRGLGQYGENLYQDGMDVYRQTRANLPELQRRIMNTAKTVAASPFSGGDAGAATARYGEARYEQKLTPGEALDAAGEEALTNAVLGRIGGRLLGPTLRRAGNGVAGALTEELSVNAFKEWVKQNLPREPHVPEANPRPVTNRVLNYPRRNGQYRRPMEE